MTNVCESCGRTFESVRARRACSAVCRVNLWRADHPDRARAQGRRRHRRRYGTDTAYTAAQKAHNAAYKRRERARCTERERLRKAKIRPGHPQFVEPVDREVVYTMHGGCCGICKQFVAADDFEVDHRVPLSRGGLHGYVNTQPAHPSCNRRKYNRLETT